MIKHIPHASSYIPKGYSFVGEAIDLSDKGVLEVFGEKDALIFPISRLICDVERLEENEPMAEKGMGICYTHNANLEPMRKVSKEEYSEILHRYYYPFHKLLEQRVREDLNKYGKAVIIDCHTYRKDPWPYEDESLYRPEICIGYDERSWVSDLFNRLDFDIRVNEPFIGSIKPLKYINDERVFSVMIEVRQDIIEAVRTPIQNCLEEIRELENSTTVTFGV